MDGTHHCLQIRSRLGGSWKISFTPSIIQRLLKPGLPTSLRQKRGESVSEYVQHFREVKNRCYMSRIIEKEAVDLAVLGLAKPIKDLAFQLEFSSLAQMMQKLMAYEHYHPDLYQEKFKRHVNMAQACDSDDSGEEQEVAVAEWARGANLVPVQMGQAEGACEGL